MVSGGLVNGSVVGAYTETHLNHRLSKYVVNMINHVFKSNTANSFSLHFGLRKSSFHFV